MPKGFAGTSIEFVIKNAGKHPVSDKALKRLCEMTGGYVLGLSKTAMKLAKADGRDEIKESDIRRAATI